MHAQPELRRLSSASYFLFPSLSPFPFSHHLKFPFTATNHSSLCSAHRAWLSEELATAAAPPEVDPVQLPSSISSLISASGDPTLQTTSSILLSAALALFLFRSLRRRAKRAKQTRLRSSESLTKTKRNPPSADEAFVGALIAAAFGVLLYKLTTSVEYTLNHQVLSSNYSVRQITISIRTIINGLCYLATFIFGFNSLGLFLYSGKLARDSFLHIPSTHLSKDDDQSLDEEEEGEEN